MNGTIIDLFDLTNDIGGQSSTSKFYLEKLVEQIDTYKHLSQDEQNTCFLESVKLIDVFDLKNDLGGQSCKSKLEKLVEQIFTYTYLS